MKKKWSVKKQDGVWKVFDKAQRLRFSCDTHFMALSFALMQGEKKTAPTAHYSFGADHLPGAKWEDVMRYILDQNNNIKQLDDGSLDHLFPDTPKRSDEEDDEQ